MADFDPCLAFCLREEGGWSDNPADPGGATNRGITLATLSDWRDHPCTAQNVHDLSLAETRAIYAARYWNIIRGDDLPAGVDLMVFDFGVNAGVSRSAKMLQHALAVDADAHIGPLTIEAVGKRSAFLLISALAEAQEAHYRSLPTFETFGRGWLGRVSRRRAAALQILPKAAPAPEPAPAPPPEPMVTHTAPSFFAALLALFRRS